jgi:hypothetical protein
MKIDLHFLEEVWGTFYAEKDLFGTRQSLLPEFFYFYFLSDQRHYNVKNMCVLHISGCIQILYESPLLPNKAASETFFHKSGAMRSSDWSA